LEVKHVLSISINGTTDNPWHCYGLSRNPFPQLPHREWEEGQAALASLDEPISSADEIVERLKGKVSAELVGLCISQYKPGQHVTFNVTFEEE
jgi:hypothetical protein